MVITELSNTKKLFCTQICPVIKLCRKVWVFYLLKKGSIDFAEGKNDLYPKFLSFLGCLKEKKNA